MEVTDVIEVEVESSTSDPDSDEMDILKEQIVTNDLIMSVVFDFLPFDDLKEMRLVCRDWRTLATPPFQRKSVLKLSEVRVGTSTGMDTFLEAFATTPGSRILFKNYKLSLWSMSSGDYEMMAFWEKFGPHIEYLDIAFIRFTGIDIVRDILFNYTPNLREIVIRDCNFYEYCDADVVLNFKCPVPLDEEVRVNSNLVKIRYHGGEQHSSLPVSWEEIFLAYPNIKELHFYNLSAQDTDIILQTAEQLRKAGKRNIALERLNVFNGDYAAPKIPGHIINRLISLRFPLKQLSIDLGVEVEHSLVAKLLDTYKNVQKLIIYRGPLGTPLVEFPFQVMFQKLKYLEITETVADTLDLVKYMPNLKTFAVCEPPEVEPPFLPIDVIEKTDMNFVKMPLSCKLSELRIEYDITSFDVKKLVYWFPTVVRTRLYLDNDGFRTICREWPQLEELEVLGDKLQSEGITGITTKTVENNKEMKFVNPWNCTVLKKLRTFIMNNYDIPTQLDDMSVDEGFLKMKSLHHLELCSQQITKHCWTNLFNWPQLLILVPSDGTWENMLRPFRKNFQQASKRRPFRP